MTYRLTVHSAGTSRALRAGLTREEAARLKELLAWDWRTALWFVQIEEENS